MYALRSAAGMAVQIPSEDVWAKEVADSPSSKTVNKIDRDFVM
jgi:hypothetical protein